MAGNDFCMVQLTDAGVALANGNPLRVTGRTSLVFAAGQPTRVAKYEWDMMLRDYPTTDGTTLFELVPAATPAPAAAPAATTASTATTEKTSATPAATTKETT